jgi:hypothetical protein
MITRHHAIVLVGIAALAGAVAAQQPSRDNAPAPPTATAKISGHVFVAGESKQPARRARVTLTSIGRTSPGQTATTDDSGAFTFPEVPAGRFEVQAFKNGYLRSSYGAARPERSGTPVAVKDGDAIANVDLTIARGGVIAGAVRDRNGRPVPGIAVKVLKLGYNAVTGERTLGSPSSGSSPTSDDRGEYRAFGLPPGTYFVLVNPAPGRSAGPGLDDIRPLTSAEVQRALQAARTGAPMTPAATSSSPATARVNYAPVFHPGVTDIGAAATIGLGVSDEHTGADITIQLVPTATVSGRITSPTGSMPPSLSVNLVPAGPQTELLAGAGLRGTSTQIKPDGTFVFSGVAPGSYTVRARTSGGRAMTIPQPSLWASADVAVSGQDLDVPLTLQPGVTINGRVAFEGSRPSPAELQTLSFNLMAPASGGALVSSGRGAQVATLPGRVDADGRFVFPDIVPDTYRFVWQWTTQGAGEKWAIKSSVANGREALDAPLRVNPNETVDWTITFTETPAILTGVFQDRGGRAAPDYFIVVFPADRRFWTPGSRRILTTRPGTDGAFTARGLPPGDYLLAALTDLEPGEWNDAAFLDQLAAAAVKVTLREGETTRQDLRIGG